MILSLIFISFTLTFAGIVIFRRLARRTSRLIDVPNERSSHVSPVTRGAGIAIVITVLSLYVVVSRSDLNTNFVIAASAVATISFLDDLFTMSPTLRLVIHIAAASFLILSSGPYTELARVVPFDFLAPLLSVLFIVWTTNVYNFMDGIDGIAGIQGAGAGLGWMLAGILIGSVPTASLGSIVLGSCLAFLVFNWQPAKVFMGDVGSTFLGFTLASFPLIDTQREASTGFSSLGLAVLFMWLFQFDAGLVRAAQILSAKPFWRPHRDHLYQKIVVNGYSHAQVAAYFGIFATATALSLYLFPGVGKWMSVTIAGVGAVGLLFWSRKKIDVKVD